MKKTPSTFNWKIQSENNSMINTPSTFSIYMAGLVFEWILKLGGLGEMEKLNKKIHSQPEGIVFGKDGTLYISNEGKKEGNGTVSIFREI